MKEQFMVVAIDAINEETMKLELVPLVESKTKPDILNMALSGDTQGLMKSMQQQKQHRNIIYRSRIWCAEKRILPFTGLTMEIDTSVKHKQKTKTT